jgi:hypothetical protein
MSTIVPTMSGLTAGSMSSRTSCHSGLEHDQLAGRQIEARPVPTALVLP